MHRIRIYIHAYIHAYTHTHTHTHTHTKNTNTHTHTHTHVYIAYPSIGAAAVETGGAFRAESNKGYILKRRVFNRQDWSALAAHAMVPRKEFVDWRSVPLCPVRTCTCTQALQKQNRSSLGPLLHLFYPFLFPGPVHYCPAHRYISTSIYRNRVPICRSIGTPISLGSLISFHT